jgi:hypothetical protein
LDRRLDGSQSGHGHSGERNSHLLLGLEPPIIQHVAQRYTADLSQLIFEVKAFNLIERGILYMV